MGGSTGPPAAELVVPPNSAGFATRHCNCVQKKSGEINALLVNAGLAKVTGHGFRFQSGHPWESFKLCLRGRLRTTAPLGANNLWLRCGLTENPMNTKIKYATFGSRRNVSLGQNKSNSVRMF